MAKSNFYTDNPDISFHLEKRIDLKILFDWMADEDREALGFKTLEDYENTWKEMLGTVGAFSGTTLSENAEKVAHEDLELTKDGDVKFPPTIAKNVKDFVELGGCGIGVDQNYGGLAAPMIIQLAGNEMISRACPSTLLNIAWFTAVADIIDLFGNQELKDKYLPMIAEGTASGSMALTEPDVGSDLANLRSYGEEQDDGTWRIFGNKQFISNGCGEIALVLAKNKKGATGLKSLNLFLVPRTSDEGKKYNFSVTKIEDKPGLHGSATCALEFNNSKGYLLGKDGEGFMYMLHLMNEARIAVGFQALGLMEATLRLSKDYTEQRTSWGKPIAQHEMIAEKLLDLEVETKALRSLCYQAGHYASIIAMGDKRIKSGKVDGKEKDEIKKKIGYYTKRLRDWTPLIKWYAGEKSFVHARTALQLHGGYGFTNEYKAEWWVRESLILSIYEGTSQIQALMCIKDTMKEIIRNPKGFAEIALGSKVKTLSEQDPLKKKVYRMRQIQNSAIISLLLKIVKENVRSNLSANKSSDILKMIKILSKDLVKFDNISPALLHAERICEIKSIVALARCLVWDAEVDKSRAYLAERFIDKNIPLLLQKKAEIELDDGPVMKMTGGDDAASAAAQA